MEDVLNDEVNTTVMPIPLKSVEVDVSEEPTIDSEKDDSKTVKVNGDTKVDNSDCTESSDYDNLIIDERPRNRKRKQLSFSPETGFKGFKRVKNEEDYEPPMNPYFNESLFELSELHNNKNVHSLEKSANSEEKSNTSSTTTTVNQVDDIGTNPSTAPTPTQLKKLFGKKKKAGSPKLREYAQYLGLQPTVQFKCSRCALRGFSSLALLNEHQLECTGEGPISPPASTQTTAPSTNFRVTRKVYLCSACGTYYENWNLFLHMREIHKRFVCLYCLGMFSQPEKLSLHLVTKHNCVPSQLNSEEDFFHMYKEPCFLMCCECEKVFSERDNFFGHTCCGKTSKGVVENKSKNNSNNTNSNNHRQLINQKNNKNSKQVKNSKTFVEHVTGDTTVDSKEEKMTEETQEINCKEPEDTQEDEMQVFEKEEAEDYNDKIEENCQDQVSQDGDAIDTIDENQEAGVELSKDESLDKSDVDVKARESESEVEDIAESPRYESESPVNQEESDFKANDDLIEENDASKSESDQGDTRKVPKVTLRLPKNTTPYVDHDDSDDSDKLMMEFDSVDADVKIGINDEKENKDPLVNMEPTLDVAGSEIPIIELELEHPLDKFDIQLLLQKCLKETIPTCVYCNHARKIAVNGKQLGLHAIAEHRFSAIVNSITAEELIPESFVMRIKESLSELQNVYFNLESSVLDEGMTFSHVFECFQCRYATTIHKELYLHNRKMHAKTILLCIMCKSNFYSYSELICHLCPGLYELNNDVNFRCCMCVCDDLPSAFRLMVHLRKRHHACDVCLELCHNQSRLSNHVWKHKLHHLCYRCGIAYRNKPDITKHLFWKHGTESVLCKKCLQKKWPHVYHFCIPPSTFTCEECNLNFTKAVALKVHKRIHRDEKPHACTFENCNEKFISKKLLLKHEFKHREPPEEAREKDNQNKVQEPQDPCIENADEKPDDPVKDENSNEATEKKPKLRVDVYDLPELNLSESDSSDSEEEAPKIEKEDPTEDVPKLEASKETGPEPRISDDPVVSTEASVPVLENIWDDFKLYQASKGKMDNVGKSEIDTEELPTTSDGDEKSDIKQEEIVNIIMRDHDYSLLSQEYKTEPQNQHSVEGTSIDHDYCSSNKVEPKEENALNDVSALQSPAKKDVKVSSTSDSSNDSDSSSCTCGSNCSCSGSSDSSSSSSDSSDSDSSTSEGRRKQQARRERRKRAKGKKETETSPIDVVATDNQAVALVEQHIEETDLDTTETETDEDFYDKQPQKLASKLIAEKRKELMLLAGIGTLANGAVLESSRPSTPSLPETETLKIKKKSKNKKKKKKRKQEKQPPVIDIPSTSYQYQQLPIVSPLTISLTKNSPLASPNHTSQIGSSTSLDDQMLNSDVMNISDSSLRASKRRRIPNKFYGYSSDEEADKPHLPVLKWRKADLPSPARPTPNSPMVVPPITIKALPPPPPPPTFEEPVPNRTTLNEMRVQQQQQQIGFVAPSFQVNPRPQEESGSESNESSSEEEQPQPPPLLNKPPNQPPLYCYCRCPYDEVSEMIGCDADDCLIEWFHFECVGIMVPPKGQWFCPDCRKKKQQRKELTLT
ncbi:hypothetical protein RN001_011625 [Aquatica leii]|uniref:Uncharacterized protein n=1 Tax=Aquatica leii TaxID=1421715 RepID=A0AAN7SM37_9COLE|nr:hypothetical protein RN001_011625 [Aquatica leii]